MQYSTNSNEAVRWAIQSAPTLAGQYRKARLTAESHDFDLRHWNLERQRLEIEIEKLKIKATELRETGEPLDELDAQQVEIEISKIRLNIEMNDRGVADSQRERDVCLLAMQEIRNVRDYEQIGEAAFQAELGQDLHERQLRHLVAHVYGIQMGLPGEVILELMELPIDLQARFGARLMELAQNNPFMMPVEGVAGELDGSN